jgi:hypothetical protein
VNLIFVLLQSNATSIVGQRGEVNGQAAYRVQVSTGCVFVVYRPLLIDSGRPTLGTGRSMFGEVLLLCRWQRRNHDQTKALFQNVQKIPCPTEQCVGIAARTCGSLAMTGSIGFLGYAPRSKLRRQFRAGQAGQAINLKAKAQSAKPQCKMQKVDRVDGGARATKEFSIFDLRLSSLFIVHCSWLRSRDLWFIDLGFGFSITNGTTLLLRSRIMWVSVPVSAGRRWDV